MMKSYKIHIFSILTLLGFATTGCSDELFNSGSEEKVIEGQPASISFDVQVGESQKMSRGDMPDGKDREIMTVWLGFFDANTGKLRHKRLLGTDTYIGAHEYNQSITLDGEEGDDDERISSGEYLIAAVANPRGNYGVLYSDSKKISKRTELNDLLDQIETFDQYCGVAVMRGDGTVGSIGTPTGNLPMQGVFVPNGVNCNFATNSDAVSNFYAKYAQEKVYVRPNLGNAMKLDGAIHFRRMISQNKFNITYDRTNIKSMEIIQARVYNVPVVSWIAERADNAKGNINAGDHPEIYGNAQSKETNVAPAQVNYMTSSRIMGNTIPYDAATNTFSFDWWQLDNRRTGRSDQCSKYNDREKERKNTGDGRNTGIYLALDDDNSSQVSNNNCATFVEIRVRMNVERITAETGGLSDGSKVTEAEAVYTIHLGACEGTTEASKAIDFNCRRNSVYTYNVKIKGIDNIIVEARKDEIEPGAEGTVTFVTTQYFESDAHYSAFNISLSNKERSGANWQVRVYTGQNTYKDICLKPEDEDESVVYTSHEKKYWDWIILRPTSGANVIADFKPVEDNVSSNKPFYLDQLNNIKDYPGYGDTKLDEEDTQQRYYTVFVNEYVYRSLKDNVGDDNSEDAGRYTDNWKEYVNLPDRTFWLKVQEFRSNDHESVVINSKYAIRQKSIQTYYNEITTNAIFGAEHGNETFYDRVTSNADHNSEGTSYASGNYPRSIMYNFVTKKSGSNQGMWVKFLKNSFHEDDVTKGVAKLEDTSAEFKQMGFACMNRNRDLNGDGIIDRNEIRWVLPDQNLYTYLFFGEDALSAPLFDFKNTNADDVNTNARLNEVFHYATIDGNMFWSEEGCSTGWMGDNYHNNPSLKEDGGVGGWPRQLRCVRYLNLDMQDASDKDPLEDIFSYNSQNNVITFNLTPEALRDHAATSLPSHRLGSEYAKPYRKMQFETKSNGKANAHGGYYTDKDGTHPNITISSILNGASYTNWDGTHWMEYLNVTDNNPCKDLNTGGEMGWRVANIKELAAVLKTNNLDHEFGSSTICFGNDPRIMGSTSSRIEAGKTSAILCVRDVE